METPAQPTYTIRTATRTKGELQTKIFDAPWLELLPSNEATEIIRGLESVLSGYSTSAQWRVLRGLSSLIETLCANSWLGFHDPATESGIQTWLRKYLAASSSPRGFLTAHETWSALHKCLRRLMSAGAIPHFSLPPTSGHANSLAGLVRTEPTIVEKLSLPENVTRQLASPHSADREFFEIIDDVSAALFREIKIAAAGEIHRIKAKFEQGKTMIEKCDIDRLRYYMRRGIVEDPEACVTRGQSRSFFSPNHPSGLINMVGWAYHENNGIFYDNAWKGSRHCYNHEQSTEGIRQYLGLTIDSIAPLFISLVVDLGFNVESLECAKVQDEDGQIRLILPTDNSSMVRVSVAKPRAGKMLDKLASSEGAFSLAVSMTARWRDHCGKTDLWLYPGNRKENTVRALTATGFKFGFATFLQRHPSILELISSPLTRKDVRVLAGLVEWFSSGGDMIAVSRKLNNSPSVALRNYIPKDLQDAFYAYQIRKFQSLLIVLASGGDDDLARCALRYDTLEDLNKALQKMFDDPVLSQTPLLKTSGVARRSDPKWQHSPQDDNHVFLISERNVAILTRLNDELKAMQRDSPAFNANHSINGFTPRSWQSLWVTVSGAANRSMDRAIRRTWNGGIELAKSVDFSIDFPCLSAFQVTST